MSYNDYNILWADIDDNNCMLIEKSSISQSNTFAKFNSYRLANKFCDVKIVIGDRKWDGHVVILAAEVPYFETMFSIDMLESATKEVNISEISPDIMDLLMDYIYTGKLTITADNAQSVIFAANYLNMVELVSEIGRYCICQLTIDNCLSMRKLLKTVGCSDYLINVADNYVAAYFSKISQTDSFLQLDIEDLADILSISEIGSVEEVENGGNKWLEAEDRPGVYIDRVQRCIQSCQNFPNFDGWLITFPEAEEHLENIHPQIYDPIMHRWIECKGLNISMDKILRNDYNAQYPIRDWDVVCDKNHMYIYDRNPYGGSRNTFWKYSFGSGWWHEIPPLFEGCCDSTLTINNNKLYLCGGRIFPFDDNISSKLYIFDVATGEWDYGPNLLQPRIGHCIATVGKYIYVCGGYSDPDLDPVSTVDRFDIETQQWERAEPMSQERAHFKMTVHKNRIYALGPNSIYNDGQTFEVYDPDTNIWTQLTPPTQTVNCFALVSTFQGICAVEQTEENVFVDCYDIETDQWYESSGSRVLPRYIQAAVSVPIFPYNS